jgi:hypothetical protein
MRTKKGQFYSNGKVQLTKMKLSLIQYLEENVLSHIQRERETKKSISTKWF